MKLAGKIAIVTGAGRNIGEEVCKVLAAEGASIAVVDLDKARGARPRVLSAMSARRTISSNA